MLSSLAKNPWRSYALSIGAEYIDGGFTSSDRIIVHQKDHFIVISIGTNQRGNSGYRYTRFRCSYTSNQSPYFSIRTKRFHFGLIKYFFKKKTDQLPIQKLYDISTLKEELFPILFEDEKFCTFLTALGPFKFLSEKDDGELGPVFLRHEHQLCLELEGEIEEDKMLSAGIGIVFATVDILKNNGLMRQEKSTVIY